MATKKARKGAVSVARKSSVSASRKSMLPKNGDAVWVNVGDGFLGIFVGYSPRDKVVTLRWSTTCLIPYIWPETSKSIFNVERKDIEVLSSEEVIARVDWLMRRRDGQIRRHVMEFVDAGIGGKLFSDS